MRSMTFQIDRLTALTNQQQQDKAKLYANSEQQRKKLEEDEKKIKESNTLIETLNKDSKFWASKCTEYEKLNHQKDKKISNLKKQAVTLTERADRMERSQQTTMELNQQVLRQGAQNQAEVERVRRQSERCEDRNCFNSDVCKKRHDHKSTNMNVPCHHYLQGSCKFEERCIRRSINTPKL